MAGSGADGRRAPAAIVWFVAVVVIAVGLAAWQDLSWALAAVAAVATAAVTWLWLEPAADATRIQAAVGLTQPHSPGSEPAASDVRASVHAGSGTALGPLVLGEPSRGRVQRVPAQAANLQTSRFVAPPGAISDSFSLTHYEVRAASRLGTGHAHKREPRQDDYLVTTAAKDNYLVAIVADGLGSAGNSHYGAHWTCRMLAKWIDVYLAEGVTDIVQIVERTQSDVLTQLRTHYGSDADPASIGTTVVALLAPHEGGLGVAFRIGDSDLLVNRGSGWRSAFGETAQSGLHETATKAFPVSTEVEVASVEIGAGCLLLATDGVADPIRHSPQVVGAAFGDKLRAPVDELDLSHLVGFDRRGAHDDRTAVAIWYQSKR